MLITFVTTALLPRPASLPSVLQRRLDELATSVQVLGTYFSLAAAP